MIEKISLAIVGESGDIVPIEKTTNAQLEIKLETVIADTFSAICYRNNNLTDSEIKTAEKFTFAVALKNYLKEMKENVGN